MSSSTARFTIWLVALPVWLAGCAMNVVLPGEAPPVSLDQVPIMYGFGHRHRVEIAITDSEWRDVRACFDPTAPDPAFEREQIRDAVAAFERIAGSKTATRHDVARNHGSQHGQMDCIDETANTNTYLRIMQEQGVFTWHEVTAPVYRGFLGIRAHNSAVVEDHTTGEQYVVDSWFRDNGEPPYIQTVQDWKRFRPFDDDDD